MMALIGEVYLLERVAVAAERLICGTGWLLFEICLAHCMKGRVFWRRVSFKAITAFS